MNRNNAQVDTEGRPPSQAVRMRDDCIRAEAWLAQHLWKKTGIDFQAGVTLPAQRIKRLCALLVERGLTEQVLGRFNGRDETHRQFVRRALHVDLDAPSEILP